MSKIMDRRKVVVLYRVIQEWRRNVFERMANSDKHSFMVFHGPDFPGTKVLNTKQVCNFKHLELFSFKIKKQISNGLIAMPFSPFLFFSFIKESPDVIICEGASNLLNNIIAYLYRFIFNKKIIWWSLGEIKNRQKSRIRKSLDSIINWMERKADAIIAYSSQGKEYYLDLNIPKEKIFVAVNVIDTDEKLKAISKYNQKKIFEVGHNNSKFNILFVGALIKEKKIDMLLEAYSILEKKCKDIKLTIIGGGTYENELHELANSLNVKNVHFTGSMFEGTEKYFIESDIFVLPGLGGLAISEAMVYGLPVIASIADGCENDLVKPNNGIIDENLSAESLAEHLYRLYQKPELLEEMKESSINIIKRELNINTYMQSINNAIEYVLD